MNILYDGPFTPFPKGGVVRYYRELSLNLFKSNEIYFSRYSHKDKSKDFKFPLFPHFRPHKLSFYFEYLWFKFLHKKKFDIVYFFIQNCSYCFAQQRIGISFVSVCRLSIGWKNLKVFASSVQLFYMKLENRTQPSFAQRSRPIFSFFKCFDPPVSSHV